MSGVKKLPIGELFELEKGILQSLKNSTGEFDFITAADEWKTHNEFSHDMEALIFAAAASGSLGRTHYVNGKFITSDLCYILTPKNPDKYPIDMKFYHFVFNSFKEELVKETKSGTSKEAINQKSFKAYELPYFDIEKQHLWIQKLINTKEYQQELLSELSNQKELVSKLRQSILQEAIDGKLTDQWRKDNLNIETGEELLERIIQKRLAMINQSGERLPRGLKNRDLGQKKEKGFCPDTWVITNIDTISTVKIGSTPSRSEAKYWQNDIPWVASGEVANNFIFSTKEKISYSALEEVSLNLYPIDTVLIAMIGQGKTRGQTSILKIPASTNQNVAGLIINHGLVLPKFLWYFFLSQYHFMRSKATGGNQAALNGLKIGETSIPLPPLEEQNILIEKVDNLFSMCDELDRQINESKVNVEMMMQAVLKEAFEEEPKTATVEPHAPKTFQRSVLAAYLIDNSQDDQYFGHVKLQKMLFMCEAVNNLDFDTDYKRHAMGPYDPKLIRSVDSQLKKAKWFEVKKLEGEISRYVYHPLEKVEEYKKYVGRYWDHKKIEHIFLLMKPMKTLQAEIVATLYSAYTDFKKTNMSITDEILINEARNNWHDNKKNIAEETWARAIEWMKSKNLLRDL